MEQGVVIDIDRGRVLVEAGPNASCCDCAAAGSCMIAASGGKRRIWMENSRGARLGDEVSFFIEERAVIAGSVIYYAIPVVMLVTGIVAGLSLAGRFGADPEFASIAGGVVGLIMSYGITAVISSSIKKRDLFVPRLVEVIARKTN